jgi:hypothetical protein
MKRAFMLFPVLLLTSMAVLFAEDHRQSVKVYVSKNGSDQWSGGLADPNASNTDGPLATLEAAQSRVRSLLKEQTAPVEVVIRSGTYWLKKPLVLTPEDSGKQETPVTWTSHEGERVILSGGKPVTGWKKVVGDVPGLPPNAAGKIWYADIGKGTAFYSLFDDLGILPQAISPKFKTDKNREKASYNRLAWLGSDLDHLRSVDEAVLHIVPQHFFVYKIVHVESIDKENRFLNTRNESTKAYPSMIPLINSGSTHSYYRIANVIEHLDAPGEWVLNSQEGSIYYWPVAGDRPGDDVCYPILDELISFRGDVGNRNWVRNISFRGIIFRNTERMLDDEDNQNLHAGWDVLEGRNAVIRLMGAHNISIDNCIIENSGGTGIKSGVYSANNTFKHNVIRHMGLSGISLIGHGPGKIADNFGNIISHNEIGHCGEIWACGIGVVIIGSGFNHVHNNQIHHTANHGIAMMGAGKQALMPGNRSGKEGEIRWDDFNIPAEEDTWYHRQAYVHTQSNIVEYNEVHHAAHGDRMADVNSLYCHGTGRGNVYRRNYIHDMIGSGGNAGFRADDWMWFMRVSENVFRNVKGGGIICKQTNGFFNNILIDCESFCFSFKTDWVPRESSDKGLNEQQYGTTVRRNIMVQSASMIQPIYGQLPKIPPYYDSKEHHGDVTGYYLIPQPMMEDNILFCPDNAGIAEDALATSQSLGQDSTSIAADPMFVDPEDGDFRFRDGSPALKLGITPITKYGIQEPSGLQEGYGHLDPGGAVSAARAARRELAEKATRNASAKRDLILSATAPAAITPEDAISVIAKYDVSEQRDIYVVFLRSGSKFGDARQTVEAGRGDVKLTVVPSEYPAEKGDDFMFVVMVLPVGETWRESLHLHRITGVTVK